MASKQEEIKNNVITNIVKAYPSLLNKEVIILADKILKDEDSQGAVLKVKCPDCNWSQFVGEESVGMTPCHTCNSTGYIYEPLIEEG